MLSTQSWHGNSRLTSQEKRAILTILDSIKMHQVRAALLPRAAPLPGAAPPTSFEWAPDERAKKIKAHLEQPASVTTTMITDLVESYLAWLARLPTNPKIFMRPLATFLCVSGEQLEKPRAGSLLQRHHSGHWWLHLRLDC